MINACKNMCGCLPYMFNYEDKETIAVNTQVTPKLRLLTAGWDSRGMNLQLFSIP
jgi:hypothetical protein